ncbi:Neuroligin-4, X-linked [Stylophora pistillata]|uniref:Neuroligin-4, X-linked n=1 Tax=Stylophora pistillata TaxID=50429 RepID=A0A2B4SZ60_STYPI|nr:Neuroligin-4, X-linked [Stylophora pistillata]
MTSRTMLIAALFVLAISESILVQSAEDTVVITTRYGSVRGVIRRFQGINKPIKTVSKFLGIPYASSPVNELRFKPPKPASAWQPSTYNASYYRSICIQPGDYNVHFWPNFSHPESEDCLYLNVYTPHHNESSGDSKKLYPVMVYIHGGGYEVGTPVVSPGDIVPLWGVVLVTIQYRLGPFGFVTTGDSVAPGNYGMLDQIEALKWVKENIENFGGEPSSVTIFGERAGGSSVGLHVLSPLSKGLFHRAIAISGVELSPYAIGSSATAVVHTNELAKKLGCATDKSAATITCLRSKEAQELLVLERANIWRPVVDGNFLPDTPEELRKSGRFNKVPLMAGFTSQEGAYFFPRHLKTVAPTTFRENLSFALNYILNKYGQTWVAPHKTEVPNSFMDAVIFQYTPWPYAKDSCKLKRGFSDAITDSCVAEPAHASLSYHSTQQPAFLYEFAHRSKLNPDPEWLGVRHKDDTPYQFGFPLMNLTVLQNYDEADRNISDMVLTLFTNFAKFGNPTPEPVFEASWPRFNQSHLDYLLIQGKLARASNYRPTQMAFWLDCYLARGGVDA